MTYDENKHTKLVEVPQVRVWKLTGMGHYCYVWEDGYDALAEVAVRLWGCVWWIRGGVKTGSAKTVEEAQQLALDALK